MKFSELDNEIKIKRCTVPQAVFVTKNPDDETDEQKIERQEKFLKLPENIKDKLVSHITSEKIQRIGKHYKLELLQMASIARMIRSYYFGEIKKEDFPNILVEEAGLDQKSASEISTYVIERIINTETIDPSLKNEIVKMPLTQAMEKYPKVQEQLISDNLIKLKNKDYLVKGSVRNWIKDYYNVVGAGNKDIMKRSSYIYHGQNSKDLSENEKSKLSIILKALEDNSVVSVDKNKEEIIFDVKDSKKENFSDIKKEQVQNSVYENKTQVSFGNDSENSRVQSRDQEVENRNPSPKINQIKGNRFNLKSDHFESSKEDNEDNIKFSTPQQFPVEKEKSEKNNFGHISSIE